MASGSGGSPSVRRRDPSPAVAAATPAAAAASTSQPQQWTTAMETLLIDLVASRSYLWDRRHRGYIARGKRSKTFRDIGKVMRARWPDDEQLFTFENIVHKFSQLKRRYRREWVVAQGIRIRENRPDYEPQWEHFEKLGFLERAVMQDSMDSAIDIVTPDDMSDSSHDSDEAPSDTEEPPPNAWRLGEPPPPFGNWPRYPVYESSSSSDSGDEIPAKFDPLPECYKNTKWWPKSPETARKKMYLRLAFSRYLNTVLSPVPDFLQKELARIKITHAIAKVNLPYA